MLKIAYFLRNLQFSRARYCFHMNISGNFQIYPSAREINQSVITNCDTFVTATWFRWLSAFNDIFHTDIFCTYSKISMYGFDIYWPINFNKHVISFYLLLLLVSFVWHCHYNFSNGLTFFSLVYYWFPLLGNIMMNW